jgi:hypothetical protein
VEINHRNCHLKKTRYQLRRKTSEEKTKKKEEEKKDQ